MKLILIITTILSINLFAKYDGTDLEKEVDNIIFDALIDRMIEKSDTLELTRYSLSEFKNIDISRYVKTYDDYFSDYSYKFLPIQNKTLALFRANHDHPLLPKNHILFIEVENSKAIFHKTFNENDIGLGLVNPKGQEGRLTTTTWNQYSLSIHEEPLNKLNSYRHNSYVPGCSAVAVSQLINYYFQKGYREGFLENLLEGTTAYPKFEINRAGGIFNFASTSKRTMRNLNYRTETEYSDDKSDEVVKFLFYSGIALDAYFDKGATFVIDDEGESFMDTTREIFKRLVSRFRFKDTKVFGKFPITRVHRLLEEKEYIIKSLYMQKPIYMSASRQLNQECNGKNIGGHSVLIDNYKIENNKLQVQINVGWGPKSSALSKWYNMEDYKLDMGRHCYDDFYIIKYLEPINYP